MRRNLRRILAAPVAFQLDTLQDVGTACKDRTVKLIRLHPKDIHVLVRIPIAAPVGRGRIFVRLPPSPTTAKLARMCGPALPTVGSGTATGCFPFPRPKEGEGGRVGGGEGVLVVGACIGIATAEADGGDDPMPAFPIGPYHRHPKRQERCRVSVRIP